MEQCKERPVFTEHPPMSKIIRAEATKFPVLDQAQPESAKELFDAFHDNTDDTVERYDNKRFSVCGIIKSIGADEHGKPSIQKKKQASPVRPKSYPVKTCFLKRIVLENSVYVKAYR